MNRIFAFTSTGNSLYLARILAKGLGQTEVVSIPFLMKQKKWSIEGKKIGFVIPCNYGTIPQLLKSLSRELKKQSRQLHYGRSLVICSNYMTGWYYSRIYPRQKQLSERMTKANQRCAEMIDDIKASRIKTDKINYRTYLLPVLVSPKRYRKNPSTWDSEYYVGENCNGCGICVKACPAGNIQMSNGKPEFLHNCLRCMGCIQLCPRQAFFIQGKPMNKKPYLHPEISKKELFDFHKNGRISANASR